MKRGIHSRRGAALLLTLWCIAVVSVLVIMTARIVNQDVETESSRARRFEAREIALTGLAFGRNPKLKRDSELFHQQFPDGGKLSVRIVSESGKININRLLQQPDQKPLKALFALWGISDHDADVAVDSLEDWVDVGDLRRMNGAERDQLQGQTLYSIPQNRPFRDVAEMARVRGMDVVEKAKPDWRNYFSVLSGNQIDIQDAPVDILRVFGGLTRSQAEAVVKFRSGADRLDGTGDDIVVENLGEMASGAGLGGDLEKNLSQHFQVRAEPTRIESIGTIGGISYQISVVTTRGQTQGDLAWIEP